MVSQFFSKEENIRLHLEAEALRARQDERFMNQRLLPAPQAHVEECAPGHLFTIKPDAKMLNNFFSSDENRRIRQQSSARLAAREAERLAAFKAAAPVVGHSSADMFKFFGKNLNPAPPSTSTATNTVDGRDPVHGAAAAETAETETLLMSGMLSMPRTDASRVAEELAGEAEAATPAAGPERDEVEVALEKLMSDAEMEMETAKPNLAVAKVPVPPIAAVGSSQGQGNNQSKAFNALFNPAAAAAGAKTKTSLPSSAGAKAAPKPKAKVSATKPGAGSGSGYSQVNKTRLRY